MHLLSIFGLRRPVSRGLCALVSLLVLLASSAPLPFDVAQASSLVSSPGEPALTDPSPMLELLAVDPLNRAHGALVVVALDAADRGERVADLVADAAEQRSVDASVAATILLLDARAGSSSHRWEANPSVAAAIQTAASVTGISHDYLWKTAGRESGFDPRAAARTSSALGLFQFVEQTWLRTLYLHGAKHGYPASAALVTMERGRARVSNPILRRKIVSLRTDPALAARMAAELARDNRRYMVRQLGRGVTDGELYAAHFLGPEGAVRLIRAARVAARLDAARLFPEAARSNPSLFWLDGKPATTAQLLERLAHG